jgi:predicted secreted hydrolase
LKIKVRDHWKSPRSKAKYPSRWRIEIPSEQISLEVAPFVADQELLTSGSTGVTYWEGAVYGRGISRGHDVSAEGYIELTGYAGGLGSLF